MITPLLIKMVGPNMSFLIWNKLRVYSATQNKSISLYLLDIKKSVHVVAERNNLIRVFNLV